MGAAEQRVRSQKNAEDLKRRGVVRKTGQCPWGCGGQYVVNPHGGGSGASLMNHLNQCQGGGAKKRQRLTNLVLRVGKRTRR